MPIGYVSAAAAVGGLALNVANSSGGGGGYANGSSPPPSYQPTGQPAADTSYQGLVNSMVPYATSIPSSVIPQLQQYTGNITGNPYAAGALAGATAAAGYGTGTLAPMQEGAAASLYGQSNAAIPYATSILRQGFDPQTALYDQGYQRNQDQSNAINAMNGVAGSPYGAGLMGQSAQNFNTAWDANQLQRENAAVSGYNTLMSSAGQGYAAASQLGGSALSSLTTSAALPYSTYLGQQTDATSALNGLSSGANGAYGLDQNTLNALSAYLKLGQSATSVGQAGAAQNFAQNAYTGQALGSALSGLSNNPGLSSLFSSSQPQDIYNGNSGQAGLINYGPSDNPTYGY